MSKVSIVGVEGSGKTTLMAAFGEKCERSGKPRVESSRVIFEMICQF